MSNRYVDMAVAAKQEQRFEDMVEWIKKDAKLDLKFNMEDVHLLDSVYQTLADGHRAMWTAISLIDPLQTGESNSNNEQTIKHLNDLKHKVEEHVSDTCNDMINLIDGSKMNNEQTMKHLNDLKHKAEEHLSDTCNDMIGLVDDYLIPLSRTAEARTFAEILKEDYKRYLVEFKTGKVRIEAADEMFEGT